jgi:serine/threonine protein kinase
LKPDNVGFSTDGVLKLFDFGLATCVKSRTTETDAYEMTGFTGSLRYMAPESALRKPYSEKVDVFSFGILVWQMARDKVPFKGLGKEEFLRNISLGGVRPKLDSSWPQGFSNLLTRCWHENPIQRPSFAAIVEELDRLVLGDTNTPMKGRRGTLIKGSSDNQSSSSSWF